MQDQDGCSWLLARFHTKKSFVAACHEGTQATGMATQFLPGALSGYSQPPDIDNGS
jgi:hypothetical protein